jgi:phage terminase large subunit-like protein
VAGREAHPVLMELRPRPDLGYDDFCRLVKLRQEKIKAEQEDPIRYGWEPPVWRLCDALLGMPWMPKDVVEMVLQTMTMSQRIRILLLMGANRSGKSRYAARTVMKVLLTTPGARAWCYHENNQNSIEYQQPYLYEYMPVELRGKAIKTPREYISYSKQNGFAESRFVLPNMSDCSFRNYEQDVKKAESGEVDIVWCDELAPVDLVETLNGRIATLGGILLVTFTPIEGYSGTVKIFQDGATPVCRTSGRLLPSRQGAPDPAGAFGLDAEHFQKLMDWQDGKGPALSVWSKPEPLDEILASKTDPAFETVPRVSKCVDEKRAVVYFHGRDNPYGNPVNVYNVWKKSGPDKMRERLYGMALKAMEARFPKFREDVHTIPAQFVPAERKLFTTYFFLDPASARNPFMKWYKRTREATYLYREWPGNYEIPGASMYEGGPGPGPWAVPDGKRQDGGRGPAQKPFGFGLLRIKMEIARLEGWSDWKQYQADLKAGKTHKAVEAWEADKDAAEVVRERFIDSRAASSPRVENDRPVTLLEDFERLRVPFTLTPGREIDEGVVMINDALDYDPDKAMDFLNQPKYFISRECRNTIFSYLTWTGVDGNKGACKDPIDLDAYYFLSDLTYLDESREWFTAGSGAY